jgi:nucleotide-binding universal stress UspA family protein
MLVTQSDWHSSGQILSAIETESQEAQHLKINQNILEHTYCVSHLLDSNVHLMNCYLGESMSMAIKSKPDINQKLLHLQHLAHLSEKGKYSTATLHVCEGLPEYGVSELAQKYHVNMVVLGTSEHANFINNVTGHTSEYIIDQLNCDVLTIKSPTNLYH